MLRKRLLTKPERRILAKRKRVIKARRPYHRRILLHPIGVFFLLCLGVLLVGVTLNVYADEITVVGQKLSPNPTEPITFHSLQAPVSQNSAQYAELRPADSTGKYHSDQSLLLIRGGCPKDTYIKFTRNDIFAGTTMCNGDLTFSIILNLYKGLSIVRGHVFNLTDGEGPVSVLISIMYSDPASSAEATEPFFLTSEFSFRGVYVNKPFEWEIILHNGSPDYTLVIDWGDGTNSTLSANKQGAFSLAHTYKAAGGYNGNYAIKITVTDSKGASAFLQLVSIVNERPNLAVSCVNIADDSTCSPPFLTTASTSKNLLRLAWPIYGVVLLMTVSFWLGERQEIYLIFKKRPSAHWREHK